MRYPLVAAQLFGMPLMAQPEAAHAFADAFVAILAGASPAPAVVAPAEVYTSRHASAKYKDKPYPVTEAGVGILPVYGAMVQRMGQIQPDCSEMASYEKLGRRFDAMVADSDVKAIMLEIDSPGGQVAGNFELARRIMAARDVKPVWAHANESAYSGGYSLGASASRLFVADTGGVGSIGVLMLHMNQAKRDEKQGYEYAAFYSGARKNDMNPHFPLSDEAKTAAQATVDRLHNVFAQHVAQARGMPLDHVNATQSGLLDASEALAGGFVDGISTFRESLSELERQIAGRRSTGTPATASQRTALVPLDSRQIFARRAQEARMSHSEIHRARQVSRLEAAAESGDAFAQSQINLLTRSEK